MRRAHSWVRKTLNIDMEGEQTDYVWGVVDMIPDTDFPDIRNKSAIHSNHGSCMLIPRESDKVRLYVQLGSKEAIDATNGRVDKDQLGPEKLLNVARKSMAPYTIRQPKAIDWWTIYRIGQRVAAKYSRASSQLQRNIDLEPGQGMNASMNDTHNLAWKLIHVIRGWAKPSLLATYELERRKYAQDLIAFDKQFAKMFSGKIRADDVDLDGVSVEEFTNAFHTFGGFTSGLGICYQESPIVSIRYQAVASGLILGKRLPSQLLLRVADGRPFELQHLLPSDARFKILVFTGDIYDARQRAKVSACAADMDARDGFLRRSSPGGNIFAIFDILAITPKGRAQYADLPEFLRSHWSKVFVDKQTHPRDRPAYLNYGVGPTGALVVIRPDGYIGAISSLDQVGHLNAYFEGIMRP
ncbi:hypothetical protein DXG01_002873 [Tephrocybe rancida]|nr:hypothetical protein DXG01_002873 [Tephrocybe rancida]